MNMKYRRERQARLEAQEVTTTPVKEGKLEIIVGWTVMCLILAIILWYSPDMLANWHNKEYILPNK